MHGLKITGDQPELASSARKGKSLERTVRSKSADCHCCLDNRSREPANKEDGGSHGKEGCARESGHGFRGQDPWHWHRREVQRYDPGRSVVVIPADRDRHGVAVRSARYGLQSQGLAGKVQERSCQPVRRAERSDGATRGIEGEGRNGTLGRCLGYGGEKVLEPATVAEG